MKVVSIGGISNDGVEYDLWLGKPYSQPALTLEQTRREGADPVVTRARRNALAMNLYCRIYGADEEETAGLVEALLAELDTENTAIQLVISDDDGGNERYRYVVCSVQADEQDEGEGTGQYLVATLVTHGETRWRANTAHAETWNVAASEETRAVTNAGSLPARPVYTVVPTDAKTGPGARYVFRRFVSIKWSHGAYSRFPVELTGYGIGGGGWDTASLVGSFDLLSESNIGVVLDGAEVRRWIVNFDDAQTRVWANMDFVPSQSSRLLEDIGSGDTVTEIPAALDISGFPVRGILQIGDEIFTYADKDDQLQKFLGVTRAAKGSSAEAHDGAATGGDVIYWLQHDVWLVYGPQGVNRTTFDDSAPDDYWYIGYDGYKPMLDLDESYNQNWYFNEFGRSGNEYKYRGVTWRPGGTVAGTATIGEPWDQLVLSRASNLDYLVASGPSRWSLPLAGTVLQVQVFGSAILYEFTGTWQMNVALNGIAVLAIPEPGDSGADFVDFQEARTWTETEGQRAEEIYIEQRCTAAMEARLEWVQIYFDEHFTYDGFTTYAYPEAVLYPEAEIYNMALTLENVTTGQSIDLALVMEIDEQLEVDTEDHTVTLLDDGSNQYQALARDSRRREVLPLAPGVNTLKVTETGLAGVTVHIEFEERTYS